MPIYRKLNVYTAYEFLGRRFDGKTRLLAAGLFLLQRGLGAGITIYAPAIVLSTVMGWRLDLTIVCSGLVVIIYTVAGGSDAVTHTQKYQLTVIFIGMFAAFAMLIHKLPSAMSFTDSLAIAGGFGKLNAVDFSLSPKPRYTFWSGTLGGMFLAFSYFGTDQSQVQRYISGASLRQSRMGLMFNAVCKIPMQFFILFLGTMLFVFYQFEQPPILFRTANAPHQQTELDDRFAQTFSQKQQAIEAWLKARHANDRDAELAARERARSADDELAKIRDEAKQNLPPADAKANDADYVFIDFILAHLPHGLIGLLVASFFAAALSSKSAELNALGSTTTIDIYRHIVRSDRSDAHYVTASKLFTVFWGLVAIGFALFAHLVENLIQAGNIIGSVFYGVVLAMFLVGLLLEAHRRHRHLLGGDRRAVAGAGALFHAEHQLSLVQRDWMCGVRRHQPVVQWMLGARPEQRGFDTIPPKNGSPTI